MSFETSIYITFHFHASAHKTSSLFMVFCSLLYSNILFCGFNKKTIFVIFLFMLFYKSAFDNFIKLYFNNDINGISLNIIRNRIINSKEDKTQNLSLRCYKHIFLLTFKTTKIKQEFIRKYTYIFCRFETCIKFCPVIN